MYFKLIMEVKMKNYILIYDDCCFYEIVTICYYLKFTNNNIVFCSLNGEKLHVRKGLLLKPIGHYQILK